MRDALATFKAKSGRSPAATESLFSCVVAKRKVITRASGTRVNGEAGPKGGGQGARSKREGHPAWRLPPIHGRQVREPGPGFSTARRATAPAWPQLRHPCRRHADARCAACRPRLTAAQGPRVEQRAIVARTFQKSRLPTPSPHLRTSLFVMPAQAGIALHRRRRTPLVEARSLAMLSLVCSARKLQSQGLSSAFGSRVTFSLRAQRESNQRERAPRLALAGHPARQVRESGPGFSSGHPARAKRRCHPWQRPLCGLSTPTHRRTGAPVEQRAIVARTFQKSQSRAGAARGL